MLEQISNFVSNYGAMSIILLSFLEGLFLFGWYIPASIVLISLTISSVNNLPQMFLFVFLATLGSYISFSVNYFIGYFGFNTLILKIGGHSSLEKLEKLEKRIGDNLDRAVKIFAGFPNVYSVVAISAGVFRYKYKNFLFFSLVSLTTCNLIWVSIIYFSTETVKSLLFN